MKVAEQARVSRVEKKIERNLLQNLVYKEKFFFDLFSLPHETDVQTLSLEHPIYFINRKKQADKNFKISEATLNHRPAFPPLPLTVSLFSCLLSFVENLS
jgi:hypothetical protein